jgi:hypothetical protein
MTRAAAWRIERYDDSHRDAWDQFVRTSKNGTFLIYRDYMEYHRDRFEDSSILAYDPDGRLAAICPAHAVDSAFVSHAGLTYGGLIVDATMTLPRMLELFESVVAFLKARQFRTFLYKTVPHIHHRAPAEEDRFALFQCQATVVRRAVMTVVSAGARVPFQKRRLRGRRAAERHGLVVQEGDQFPAFWKVLSDRLRDAFAATPVHSLAEITALSARFSKHIRLFGCWEGPDLVAGVVVYETDRVARAQYIAASPRGLRIGGLDLLLCTLVEDTFRDKPYFDFGTGDGVDGRFLNRGLVDYKEGFGGRAVVHDHYELSLATIRPGQLTDILK